MSFTTNNDKASEEVGIAEPAEIVDIEQDSKLTQVTVVVPNATVGMIAFEAIARNNDEYEPVLLSGSAYSLDVSSGIRTFTIPNRSVHSIKGTPTGLDGDDWHILAGSTND